LLVHALTDARYCANIYLCDSDTLIQLFGHDNGVQSIYRDATGNRVRVVKSVFEPKAHVTLNSAKDNPVDLEKKNMAALYKIQHRFSRHRTRIHKGTKARQSVVAPGVGGDARLRGAAEGFADVEIESQPSAISDLSMQLDERALAEDPSRWGSAVYGRGLGRASLTSQITPNDSAEVAKQGIIRRIYGDGKKEGGADSAQSSGKKAAAAADSDSDSIGYSDSEEESDMGDAEDISASSIAQKFGEPPGAAPFGSSSSESEDDEGF
jgi:hypothetical protein